MHRREERVDVALVVAAGETDVAEAECDLERMDGRVEPELVPGHAEGFRQLPRELVLAGDGKRPLHEPVFLVRCVLGDERAQLWREHREDLADLGRAHAGLVVLEQYVVRVVVGCEALDVLAAELHGALEPRPERREVGLLAGLDPHLVGVRRGLDEPRREICRDATGAGVVAEPHPDQRGVVGVVRERVGIWRELLIELAESIVRLELVGDLLDRAELRRASRGTTGRHEHRHVPDEDCARSADVRELSEPLLESASAASTGSDSTDAFTAEALGTLAPWRTSRRSCSTTSTWASVQVGPRASSGG